MTTPSQEVVYERMTTLARDAQRAHQSQLPAGRPARRLRELLHRAA